MGSEELDETMTLTQQSQFMRERFPPQDSKQKSLTLQERQSNFNAGLIAKNNNEESDKNVHDVLLSLDTSNDNEKFQKLTKIKKDQLWPGLAFLEGKTITCTMNIYKKNIKVDDLRSVIISVYNNLLPKECNECDDFFNDEEDNEISLKCFICNIVGL